MWSGQGSDEKWYYNWNMRFWAGMSFLFMLWGLATVSSRELFFFQVFTLSGAPAFFAGIALLIVGAYSGFSFLAYVKKNY